LRAIFCRYKFKFLCLFLSRFRRKNALSAERTPFAEAVLPRTPVEAFGFKLFCRGGHPSILALSTPLATLADSESPKTPFWNNERKIEGDVLCSFKNELHPFIYKIKYSPVAIYYS